MFTNRVKPTSAVVHHEPGVPPGWPSRTTKPTIKEGAVFNLTQSDLNQIEPEGALVGVNGQMPNKGFVDWVLNAIGFTTTPKPLGIIAPKDCPKCGECLNFCFAPLLIFVFCLECGITYKHNRIVGGVETQVNAYPWMTALMYNGRFYCGASVISNKYLITAAHCVNR